MIEKLRAKTAGEIKAELEKNELGKVALDLMGDMIQPQLPDTQEIMDKINEIIDVVNGQDISKGE